MKLRTGILVHFRHLVSLWVNNRVLRAKYRQFLIIPRRFALNNTRIHNFRLRFENLLVSSSLANLIAWLHVMSCHFNYSLPVVPFYFVVVWSAAYLPNGLHIGLNRSSMSSASADLIWILALIHSFWSHEPYGLLGTSRFVVLEHFLVMSLLIRGSHFEIVLVWESKVLLFM